MEKNNSNMEINFTNNESNTKTTFIKLNKPQKHDADFLSKEYCDKRNEEEKVKNVFQNIQSISKSTLEEKEEGEIEDDKEENKTKDDISIINDFKSEYSINNPIFNQNQLIENNDEDDDEDDNDEFSITNKRLKIDEGESFITNLNIPGGLDRENFKNDMDKNKLEQIKIASLAETNILDGPEKFNKYRDCDQVIVNESAASSYMNFSATSSAISFKELQITSSTHVNDASTVTNKIPPQLSSLSKLNDTTENLLNHKHFDPLDSNNTKSICYLENVQRLKVPPLKIIYTNPNGGHPYIKTETDPKSSKNEQQTFEKKEADFDVDLCSKNDINFNSSIEISNILTSPITNNKCNRTLKVTETIPNSSLSLKTNINKRLTSSSGNSFQAMNNSFPTKQSPTPSSMILIENKTNSSNNNNFLQNAQNNFQVFLDILFNLFDLKNGLQYRSVLQQKFSCCK